MNGKSSMSDGKQGSPTSARRRSRVWLLGTVLAATLLGGSVFAALDRHRPAGSRPSKSRATNEPVARACALDPRFLVRIWRGTDLGTSGDLLLVPRAPNFIGSFSITSHSGPWRYLQEVPLVLYGPGHIEASGPLEEHASVTDIYPTVGQLLDVDLPPRDGSVLERALADTDAVPPKLVVVVVWDGAGRGMLERWPGRWPTLERIERAGTSYLHATVGSAPSTTPAIHSSIGTGSFPRSHGVTGNFVRVHQDRMRRVFAHGVPRELKLSTFADEIDLVYDNESRVGLLAWLHWHLGMLGRGAGAPGGDADQAARLDYSDRLEVTGNDEIYSVPEYLAKTSSIHRHIDRLDRADGNADGRWLGHDIDVRGRTAEWGAASNPAWAQLQADLVLEMLERDGYGRDDIPDIFFTNFKMTDFAGHIWSIDSEEVAAVLEAQDAALGRILRYLDDAVGDYVVIVTADHGATPSPQQSGAWPISQDEVVADIDRHFGVPGGSSLVKQTALFDVYLDPEVMADVGVAAADVARFMNSYTIGENWSHDELPVGYEGRAAEQVFSAVVPTSRLDAVMRCAFGSKAPPRDLDA